MIDRRNNRGSILLLSLWALHLALVGLTCASTRQASFALTEPLCMENPAGCEQRCGFDPNGPECRVAMVLRAEEIVTHGHLAGLPPRALVELHTHLIGACNAGIVRACTVDQPIGAATAAVLADRPRCRPG